MKTLTLLLFSVSAFAQTAVFPGSVVTDAQLKVQVNGVVTMLTAQLSAVSLTASVGSCFGVVPNTLATIDMEIVPVSACTGTVMTFSSRGFDGTTAALHQPFATVSLFIAAWHHNSLRVETEAIETALNAMGVTTSNGANNLKGASFSNGPTGWQLLGPGPFVPQVMILTAAAANTNGDLVISPRGTATQSEFLLYNSDVTSSAANTANFHILVNGTSLSLQTSLIGSGTPISTMTVGEGSTASALTAINFNFHGLTQASLTNAGLFTTQTLNIAALPPSAGSGGLYVCADNVGNTYRKSSCP